MGVHRVLNGQLVQAELGGYRGDLLLVGPVEPDPGQTLAAAGVPLA
jgi:hypothetical protein